MQLNAHSNVAGCSLKQFEELHFGVFQSRVWHVVDESDADAIGTRGTAFQRSLRMPVFLSAQRGGIRPPSMINGMTFLQN